MIRLHIYRLTQFVIDLMISLVMRMATGCHSMNLRWVPGSKTKLMQLDENLRSSIVHKNHGEWVQIDQDDKSHEIWTVVVEGDNREATPIVMIHGMAGGSNMFLKNIDFLARQRDVILLDLPGFGLSSRPDLEWKKGDKGKNVKTNEDDVEQFYTHVLEKWFQSMKLNKVILLGHSFGGYLSSVYSLSHPDRVKHLVLADPWGYSRPRKITGSTFKQKAIFYLINKLYYKVNAFTPIRALGPLGPKAFRSLRRDLNTRYNVFEDDDTTFIDYLYACNTTGDPSGEQAFAKVSLPFAFARKPMIDRAQDWHPDLDVTFICGKESWMNSSYGEEVEGVRPDSYTDMQIVEDAGHHVHTDQARVFNHIVQQITTAVDNGCKPTIIR